MVAFNFAVQRGYAVTNPAETTSKAKVVGEAPGILTVDQTISLLKSTPPEILPYFLIGTFAGLRVAELERLDWVNVDQEAGLIEVTAKKAKSSRRRFVRIQSNLAQWLMPYRINKGPVCGANLRKHVDSSKRLAGIHKWPENAMRHSFASYHLAHFNDAAALALEMGHTNSGMIFDHYRQLVRPDEARAFWNIRPEE